MRMPRRNLHLAASEVMAKKRRYETARAAGPEPVNTF